MLRSLQRAYTGSDCGIGVSTSGRYNPDSKCRVVTTAMLRMENKQNIKRTGFQRSVVVTLQHEQKILCQAKPLLGIAYMKRTTMCLMPVHIVSIGNGSRKL